MAKLKQKPVKRLMRHGSGDTKVMRKSRIEDLKIMINNKDYVDEAIQKLANSLTSGLMK
jgi:hypothetical protein